MANSIEAALLQQRLSNEGVECFLTNENSATLLPHFHGMLGSGIQIMVHEDDLTKALEILMQKNEEDAITQCPYCGSGNIGYGIGGKGSWKKYLSIVLTVFFVGPLGYLKNRYYCKQCKEEFS